MNLKDATIIQDMKIFQQLISSLPQTGNQFFFIMMQNVGTDEKKSENKNFDLMEFVESLPHPRMANLNEYVVRAAVGRFGNLKVANDWLGCKNLIDCIQSKGNKKIEGGKI